MTFFTVQHLLVFISTVSITKCLGVYSSLSEKANKLSVSLPPTATTSTLKSVSVNYWCLCLVCSLIRKGSGFRFPTGWSPIRAGQACNQLIPVTGRIHLWDELYHFSSNRLDPRGETTVLNSVNVSSDDTRALDQSHDMMHFLVLAADRDLFRRKPLLLVSQDDLWTELSYPVMTLLMIFASLRHRMWPYRSSISKLEFLKCFKGMLPAAFVGCEDRDLSFSRLSPSRALGGLTSCCLHVYSFFVISDFSSWINFVCFVRSEFMRIHFLDCQIL